MAADLLGFSHLSLSCTDLDTSRDWWCRVLGFQVFEYPEAESWREVILVHPRGVIVGFQQHDSNGGERFDPTRTGFDHIAFRVARRSDLDEWEARLDELGVPYTPTIEKYYGAVLNVKDPDGIAIELFHREGHPDPTRLADVE